MDRGWTQGGASRWKSHSPMTTIFYSLPRRHKCLSSKVYVRSVLTHSPPSHVTHTFFIHSFLLRIFFVFCFFSLLSVCCVCVCCLFVFIQLDHSIHSFIHLLIDHCLKSWLESRKGEHLPILGTYFTTIIVLHQRTCGMYFAEQVNRHIDSIVVVPVLHNVTSTEVELKFDLQKHGISSDSIKLIIYCRKEAKVKVVSFLVIFAYIKLKMTSLISARAV